MNRIERPDIKALITETKRIELSDNQMFCSTKSTFELWNKEPLAKIYRISRKNVLWEIGNFPEI